MMPGYNPSWCVFVSQVGCWDEAQRMKKNFKLGRKLFENQFRCVSLGVENSPVEKGARD